MTDSTAAKPEDGAPRHHRRSSSRSARREAKRPSSRRPSLLSTLGRRLTRKGKAITCFVIVILAVVSSVLAHRLESGESTTHNSFVTVVGFAPALFVMVLSTGTLLLAQAIGYKRKRLWITTAVLIAYLLLHAVAWQHAYTMAREAMEPQIIGDPDNPNPTAPATPGSIDVYVMALYTMGTLCAISALLLMRRLVRWSTPSSTSKLQLAADKASAEGTPDVVAGEDHASPQDEAPRDETSLEAREIELATLDAPAAPIAAPPSKPQEPTEDERPAKRRTRRIFE